MDGHLHGADIYMVQNTYYKGQDFFYIQTFILRLRNVLKVNYIIKEN